MVITLLSLVYNLSYRIQSLPSFLNRDSANIFLNKLKKVRAEQLLGVAEINEL